MIVHCEAQFSGSRKMCIILQISHTFLNFTYNIQDSLKRENLVIVISEN